jgi:outer membrane protein
MVHQIKFYVVAFILTINLSYSQDFDPIVNLAWLNNSQLKAKEFNLQAANAEWQEAKALFGPTIGASVQYTLAFGGRTIDLPIGDLMNPVYSKLNELTQTNSFPQIENTAIQFLPNNFYDAKIRATQPIYYPDLIINKDVRAATINLKELEKKAYKRQISKESMDAYFQYLMAKEAIGIYKASDTLLQEAKRITESMIKNGIATPLALARIENQLATIQAYTVDGLAVSENAAAALRFTIGISEETAIPIISLSPLPDTILQVPNLREDIKQLENARSIYNYGIVKEKQFYLPRIGAFVDLGSQDFNFGLQPYILGGLNLEINLYDHKRHKHKIDQYKAQLSANDELLTHSQKQISLLQKVSYTNLVSTVRQAHIIKSRIPMSRKVFYDALRRYKEGNGQYLEIIDAQSQVMQVDIQYNIARLKAWQRWSEYIYATATYQID